MFKFNVMINFFKKRFRKRIVFQNTNKTFTTKQCYIIEYSNAFFFPKWKPLESFRPPVGMYPMIFTIEEAESFAATLTLKSCKLIENEAKGLEKQHAIEIEKSLDGIKFFDIKEVF